MKQLLAVAAWWRLAASYVVEGELPAGKAMSWSWYVGKFTFDVGPNLETVIGTLRLEMQGVIKDGPHSNAASMPNSPPCYGPCETQGNFYFMVFDDERSHWKEIHDNWAETSCEEMRHYANWAWEPKLRDSHLLWADIMHIKEHIRPRLWYFLFMACNVSAPAPVRYRVHATNTHFGYQREFGFDLYNMLPMEFLAALLFTALAATGHALARGAAGFYRARPLLLLAVISAGVSAAASAGFTCHYWTFARDGQGLPDLEVFSALLRSISNAVLMLLFVLVACGWSLWTSSRHAQKRTLLLAGLGVTALLTALCEMREAYFHDTSSALDMYASVPGLLRIFLSLGLFAVSAAALVETYMKEDMEEMKQLYLWLLMAYSIYFCMLPLQVMLAVLVSAWWRLKVVTFIGLLSRLVLSTMLIVFLRPSRLDLAIYARLEAGNLLAAQEQGEDKSVAERDAPDVDGDTPEATVAE